MNFGEKFRLERVKRRLTQQEAADALGLNRRMITLYENGHSFPRTRESLKKIADFFEVDVNYLLTDEDNSIMSVSKSSDRRAMKKAQKLVDGIAGLFASGVLSECDRDTIMRELQDIYWEARAWNWKKQTLGKCLKSDPD